jgi:hypothetical protein
MTGQNKPWIPTVSPANVPGAPVDVGVQVTQSTARIEQLQAELRGHRHGDSLSTRTNLQDLLGLIEVVSIVPTVAPTGIWGQVKIYTSGTTYRLYWYDYVGHTWHYITATA